MARQNASVSSLSWAKSYIGRAAILMMGGTSAAIFFKASLDGSDHDGARKGSAAQRPSNYRRQSHCSFGEQIRDVRGTKRE
jgi:hypothetical protein